MSFFLVLRAANQLKKFDDLTIFNLKQSLIVGDFSLKTFHKRVAGTSSDF